MLTDARDKNAKRAELWGMRNRCMPRRALRRMVYRPEGVVSALGDPHFNGNSGSCEYQMERFRQACYRRNKLGELVASGLLPPLGAHIDQMHEPAVVVTVGVLPGRVVGNIRKVEETLQRKACDASDDVTFVLVWAAGNAMRPRKPWPTATEEVELLRACLEGLRVHSMTIFFGHFDEETFASAMLSGSRLPPFVSLSGVTFESRDCLHAILTRMAAMNAGTVITLEDCNIGGVSAAATETLRYTRHPPAYVRPCNPRRWNGRAPRIQPVSGRSEGTGCRESRQTEREEGETGGADADRARGA